MQGLGAGEQPATADHSQPQIRSMPQTRSLAQGEVLAVGQAPEGGSCPLPQQRTWSTAGLERLALSGPGPMEARWRAAGLAQQQEQQGHSALEAFMLQQEQQEQQQQHELQRQQSVAQSNTGSRRLLSQLWHQSPPPPPAMRPAGGLTLTRLEPSSGVQLPAPPPAAAPDCMDADADTILLGLKLGCVIGEPPGQPKRIAAPAAAGADAATAAAAAAGAAVMRPSAEAAGGGGGAPRFVGSVCSSLTGPSMATAMEVDDWWDSFSDGEHDQQQQQRRQNEHERLMLTGHSLQGKPSAADGGGAAAAAAAATPISFTGECTTATTSTNANAIANSTTSAVDGSLTPHGAALTATWSSWDRSSAATCTTQHTTLTLTLPSRPHSVQGYAPSAPWLTASATSTSGPYSAHNSPFPPRSAAAAGAPHNRRVLQGLPLLPPAKAAAPRWRRTSAAAAVGGGSGGGAEGRLREMLAAPLPVTDAASTLGLDGGLLGELDCWLDRDGGGSGGVCSGSGMVAGPSMAESDADALFKELLLLP